MSRQRGLRGFVFPLWLERERCFALPDHVIEYVHFVGPQSSAKSRVDLGKVEDLYLCLVVKILSWHAPIELSHCYTIYLKAEVCSSKVANLYAGVVIDDEVALSNA
jgi:hypothetical protein